jgi:hypothetical protein
MQFSLVSIGFPLFISINLGFHPLPVELDSVRVLLEPFVRLFFSVLLQESLAVE